MLSTFCYLSSKTFAQNHCSLNALQFLRIPTADSVTFACDNHNKPLGPGVTVYCLVVLLVKLHLSLNVDVRSVVKMLSQAAIESQWRYRHMCTACTAHTSTAHTIGLSSQEHKMLSLPIPRQLP